MIKGEYGKYSFLFIGKEGSKAKKKNKMSPHSNKINSNLFFANDNRMAKKGTTTKYDYNIVFTTYKEENTRTIFSKSLIRKENKQKKYVLQISKSRPNIIKEDKEKSLNHSSYSIEKGKGKEKEKEKINEKSINLKKNKNSVSKINNKITYSQMIPKDQKKTKVIFPLQKQQKSVLHKRFKSVIEKNKKVKSKVKIKQNYVFETNENEYEDKEEDFDTVPLTPKIAKIPSFKAQGAFNSIKMKNINIILDNIKIKLSFIQFLSLGDLIKISLTSKSNYKKIFENFYDYYILTTQNNKHSQYSIYWKKIESKSKLFILQRNLVEKLYYQHIYSFSENITNKIIKNIHVDVYRTLPEENEYKKGSNNYVKLCNFLKAYSSFNPQLGYVQGMNFIGAIALKEYNEEIKAFIFFDGLMRHFDFEKLMNEDGKYLREKVNELSKVMKDNEIIEYLKKEGLSHENFTIGWILTLFSNIIKRDKLVILWDFIFMFEWKFIFYFIDTFFEIFKDKIVEMSFRDGSYIRKDIFQSEEFNKQINNLIMKSVEKINK